MAAPLIAVATIAPVGGSSGGTSAPVDTTNATLLMFSVASWNGGATINDSKGNGWLALTRHVGSYGNHQFFFCKNPSAGTGHTFAVAGSYSSAIVYAFSGAWDFDVESGAGTTTAGPLASGSVTPSLDGALVVTGLAANTGATDAVAPAGFALTTVPNSAGNHLQTSAAYLVQTTKAPINPTWSWSAGSHDYSAVSTAVFVPSAAVDPTVPSLVQTSPHVRGNSVTSVTLTFASPPKAGNAIVIPASLFTRGFSGSVAATDSYGNSYAVAQLQVADPLALAVVYCPRVIATGPGFTITLTCPQNRYWEITALEVGNVGSGLIVDQAVWSNGSGTTPATGSTAALTASKVFAVALATLGTNLSSLLVDTVSPAWTEIFQNLDYSGTVAGEADVRSLSGVAGSTQACGWTIAPTTTWIATLVVFSTGLTVSTLHTTQDVVEVLTQPSLPPTRLSQDAIEVLSSRAVNTRVTHDVVEVLSGGLENFGAGPPVNVSQVTVEVATLPDQSLIQSRLSQVAVEVLWGQPLIINARLSQVVVEILHSPSEYLPSGSGHTGTFMGDIGGSVWVE